MWFYESCRNNQMRVFSCSANPCSNYVATAHETSIYDAYLTVCIWYWQSCTKLCLQNGGESQFQSSVQDLQGHISAVVLSKSDWNILKPNPLNHLNLFDGCLIHWIYLMDVDGFSWCFTIPWVPDHHCLWWNSRAKAWMCSAESRKNPSMVVELG